MWGGGSALALAFACSVARRGGGRQGSSSVKQHDSRRPEGNVSYMYHTYTQTVCVGGCRSPGRMGCGGGGGGTWLGWDGGLRVQVGRGLNPRCYGSYQCLSRQLARKGGHQGTHVVYLLAAVPLVLSHLQAQPRPVDSASFRSAVQCAAETNQKVNCVRHCFCVTPFIPPLVLTSHSINQQRQ